MDGAQLSKPIGWLLAANDKRKAVTIKQLSSISRFEQLCKSMVASGNGQGLLALQIESADFNTHGASELVGQWLALQEYEFKGHVEGKGQVDKLFTGLIPKQVYQQLTAEGKKKQMSSYIQPIGF